ncbi:MAG: galactosyldiacylglycerol synthase [Chloroflexota bacterium]
MVRLRDKETDADLGEISEEDFQFLQDQLEEESAEDTDYYISRDELTILKEGGGPAGLMQFLEGAMGSREGVEVSWAEAE